MSGGLYCLVATVPGDIHAHGVAWALTRSDLPTEVWVTTNFPEHQYITISYYPQTDVVVQDRLFDQTISLQDLSVFWARRMAFGAYSSVHPEDISYLNRERRHLFEGLWGVLDDVPFKVNPGIHPTAHRKAKQLGEAVAAGFKVPKTIITNSRSKIIDTFGTSSSIVVKTFSAANWNDGVSRAAWAKRIQSGEVPEEESVSLAPLIVQAAVQKRSDIRCVVFGRSQFYFSVSPRETRKDDSIDWRVGGTNSDQFVIEAYVPEASIRSSVDRFMQRCGAVHGSFDFVLELDGTLCFLEFNENGQYLWLESLYSDARLFEASVGFLRSKDPKFLFDQDRRVDPSLKDYLETQHYADMRERDAEAVVRSRSW